jgi:hypothetical protein
MKNKSTDASIKMPNAILRVGLEPKAKPMMNMSSAKPKPKMKLPKRK